MNKKTVLIVDLIKDPTLVEQQILSDAQVIACDAKIASDISDDLWEKCEAVIAYDAIDFNESLLKKMKNCKIISRAGIGFDNIDLAAALQQGIIVCNVPDYCTAEVANHAFAFLLSFAAGIPRDSQSFKKGNWERMNETSFRVSGKTIGIVGLGRIGSNLAKKAHSIGLNIAYYDPYNNEDYKNYARVDSLHKLANVSDIISIHAPLTQETNMMINSEFFKNCKNGACLINTARGDIVDLTALYAAMRTDKISCAGLDVLNIEPPNGKQSLVNDYRADLPWLHGRLIITPHSSFYTKESYRELREKSAYTVENFFNGNKIANRLA